MLEAYGTRHSVSEVCEQIAWLSAALRSSPHNDGVAIATPHLETIVLKDGRAEVPELTCLIVVRIERVEDVAPIPGRCWYFMFRNPVLVAGFPTPIRSEAQKGLEMPLAMMTRLVDTGKIQEFDGSLFIKGFSSMLYPTRRAGRLLVWHHGYNADGEHLSYLEHSTALLKQLSLEDLEIAQHVVGWCEEVENCAGKVTVSSCTIIQLLKSSRLS